MNLPRIKLQWLIAAALLVSAWQYLDARPLHWRPGVIVFGEPEQRPLDADADTGRDGDAPQAADVVARADAGT